MVFWRELLIFRMKRERLTRPAAPVGMVAMEVLAAPVEVPPVLLAAPVEWVAPVVRAERDMVEVLQDRTPALFEMLIILLRPLRSRAERRAMVVMEVVRERPGMSLEAREQRRVPVAREVPVAQPTSEVWWETIRD
jgi:hypothetical protein